MSDASQTKRARASHLASPWVFFLLVLLLSLPFYALGLAGERLPIATFLPMNALMAFVPMMAALVLVYRESGISGAKTFLTRAFDFRRIKGAGWVLGALLLMPLVFVLAYGVLRLEGRPLPDLHLFPIAKIAGFALMFFIAAIGEELGWQGFAYAKVRTGRSALATALILGAAWGLWHITPFIEMGRSVGWTLWQCLGAVAMRIIIVWLFENAGQSVFVAVLFHTMINSPWGVFTEFELYFDPLVMLAILAPVAGFVAALWGPSTLARFRFVKVHP
jgi:uncharacterized protein